MFVNQAKTRRDKAKFFSFRGSFLKTKFNFMIFDQTLFYDRFWSTTKEFTITLLYTKSYNQIENDNLSIYYVHILECVCDVTRVTWPSENLRDLCSRRQTLCVYFSLKVYKIRDICTLIVPEQHFWSYSTIIPQWFRDTWQKKFAFTVPLMYLYLNLRWGEERRPTE